MEIARMHLAPHCRIDLKNYINQRLIEIGKSPADFDCPIAEDSNHQPTIAEMVYAAANLRCALVVTDVKLIPLEASHD
ncbi:MAG: hypothetical protein LLF76_02410 [Planctomycetaceae bacterium]|nr:hypothetical protein [Planctomycetaceae bacterium]